MLDTRIIQLYKELTGLELPDTFGVQIEYKKRLINVRVRSINSFLLQIIEGPLALYVFDVSDVKVWFPDFNSDITIQELKDQN